MAVHRVSEKVTSDDLYYSGKVKRGLLPPNIKKNHRPPACYESHQISEKPVILLVWPYAQTQHFSRDSDRHASGLLQLDPTTGYQSCHRYNLINYI